MNFRWRGGLLYALAVVWLVFTVSLATWWLMFGLNQAEQLARPVATRTVDASRVHRMLVAEGGVFIALLLAGGVALLLGVRHEIRRQAALESFFMVFTHDLKTSLARVQLQAETLQEEEAVGASPVLARLLQDALRLQLQLENSLFVAQPDGRLWIERLDVGQRVAAAAQDFPGLRIAVTGRGIADADSRALHAVLRNLLHNAVLHGEATAVSVTIAAGPRGRVSVTLSDNGRGVASAAAAELGEPFAAHGGSGQTGFGLFVSRQLVERMGGQMTWSSADGAGFTVTLTFQGERT